MKKTILSIVLFIAVVLTVNAQYSYNKIDVTTGLLMAVLKDYSVSVEYTLTDSHGVGVQVRKNTSEGSDLKNNDETFSVSPFYRYYFSDNEASGFFSEGFIKYAKVNKTDIDDIAIYGPGVGAGYKKVSSYGLIFGANLGVGYGFSKGENDILGRGALFLGWRF